MMLVLAMAKAMPIVMWAQLITIITHDSSDKGKDYDVDVDDEVINQWQRVSVDTAGTYGSALDSDYYEEQTDDEEEEEELFGY